MKPRLVFSPRYGVSYGDHDFVTRQFTSAAKSLEEAMVRVEPADPSKEDVRLVHDENWTEKVFSGSLTEEERSRLELPFTPEISLAHRMAVGGTVLAARHALECGAGLHCGGGSHHAFRDHGEGYCALNDIAVAILKLRKEGKIRRAVVVDLDVHQGNGTASIFAGDPDVFTFSMHQGDLYPIPKEKSSLDMELSAGTGDAEYYDRLLHGLKAAMNFKPDLVVYQAGVDVWEKDRLGGLKLTERGVLERDVAVREACLLHHVPVAVTLGGGYGPTPEDTARLRVRTLRLFAGLGAAL